MNKLNSKILSVAMTEGIVRAKKFCWLAFLSTSIPTVTARNCLRIVKVRLSECRTVSEKPVSAVPPPLFRGEASVIMLRHTIDCV